MFVHAPEVCPDIGTMLSYVAHELDAMTAEHVAAHILQCQNCREELIG
jgi:hypothetical protein